MRLSRSMITDFSGARLAATRALVTITSTTMMTARSGADWE